MLLPDAIEHLALSFEKEGITREALLSSEVDFQDHARIIARCMRGIQAATTTTQEAYACVGLHQHFKKKPLTVTYIPYYVIDALYLAVVNRDISVWEAWVERERFATHAIHATTHISVANFSMFFMRLPKDISLALSVIESVEWDDPKEPKYLSERDIVERLTVQALKLLGSALSAPEPPTTTQEEIKKLFKTATSLCHTTSLHFFGLYLQKMQVIALYFLEQKKLDTINRNA